MSTGSHAHHEWMLVAPTPEAVAPASPAGVLPSGFTFGDLPAWFLADDRLWQAAFGTNRRERVRRHAVGFTCPYTAAALDVTQARVEEQLAWVTLACWLVRRSALGIDCVAHFERDGADGPWAIRQSSGGPHRLMLMRGEDAERVEASDWPQVGLLATRLLSLDAGGTVATAARAVLTALGIRPWALRYTVNWIAVEALFGPEDAHEVTYRMAHRVAFFLGTDATSARDVGADMREGYAWRSRAVHGMRLQKLAEERSLRLSHRVESILRKTLRKILLDDLTAVFDGHDREKYLDGLAFEMLGPRSALPPGALDGTPSVGR